MIIVHIIWELYDHYIYIYFYVYLLTYFYLHLRSSETPTPTRHLQENSGTSGHVHRHSVQDATKTRPSRHTESSGLWGVRSHGRTCLLLESISKNVVPKPFPMVQTVTIFTSLLFPKSKNKWLFSFIYSMNKNKFQKKVVPGNTPET